MKQKVAVVSGANKGIGFGVAKALAERSYKVIMLGRDKNRINQAAEKIRANKGDVETYIVDVSDTDQVKSFAAVFSELHAGVDVLVNNAGVILEADFGGEPTAVESVNPEDVLATLNVNTVGVLRLTQALMPLLKNADAARIVNISSGMGGITEMEGAWPGYRLSKAALNALTKVTAAETQGTNIKVNSVCPGWVRTDMGTSAANRAVDEAVPGILWAAELGEDGPTGGFFRDGEKIEW